MSFAPTQHIHYLWFIVASLFAGVMNAMAGGGSFVSFPAMLGMGIPPVEANATNTVALWPGQLTSVAALRHDIRRDILPAVAISSILGGVLGAEVLVHTRQTTFLHLIPWLILGGTLIFGVSGPISRWLRRRSASGIEEPPIHPWALGAALLPITFYIGYFGAGGGFVAMTVLALFGMERMHALNAMKVVVALLSNLCAILTFMAEGRIVWHYCLIAMIFAAGGGWLGAKFARRANGELLRWVVVATGLTIAAYFSGSRLDDDGRQNRRRVDRIRSGDDDDNFLRAAAIARDSTSVRARYFASDVSGVLSRNFSLAALWSVIAFAAGVGGQCSNSGVVDVDPNSEAEVRSA